MRQTWSMLTLRRWASNQAPKKGKELKFKKKLLEPIDTSNAFPQLFRRSGAAYPIVQGDRLVGAVVGYRLNKNPMPYSADKTAVVDFGLKNEVPFNPKEIPEAQKVAEEVTLPLVDMDNAFREPEMDWSRSFSLATLHAERFQALRPPDDLQINCPPILYGRYVQKRMQTYKVKALGKEGVCLQREAVQVGPEPLLGSYSFFALTKLETQFVQGRDKDRKELRYEPVYSSYVAHLLILASLVLHDKTITDKARFTYLMLLTRIAYEHNPEVRRAHHRRRPRTQNTDKVAQWFRPGAGTR